MVHTICLTLFAGLLPIPSGIHPHLPPTCGKLRQFPAPQTYPHWAWPNPRGQVWLSLCHLENCKGVRVKPMHLLASFLFSFYHSHSSHIKKTPKKQKPEYQDWYILEGQNRNTPSVWLFGSQVWHFSDLIETSKNGKSKLLQNKKHGDVSCFLKK